ncbi:MAG TPA: toll/interleukin-1 receptor domain-containing protein, partial [Gemmatimonadales bacterium]|nr:toll/interleukin-1 receptor domain-containing protein [Gemmatimonadales bacterium]
MRIFLSYARERLSEAQQVDAALEAEGHEVFFARDSIGAGTPFGRTIREAVAASDLFVFLVSPESVEPGSYCLTELGFAREQWPRPADRVLPVVVAAVSPESFPPHIQSLSALYPSGNLAAEVAACVQAIARKRHRARLRAAGLALAALCVVTGVGAAVWRGRDAEPRPFLSVVAVADPRPAVAGMPALVEVRGNARNPLPRIDSIVGLALELEGARAEIEGRFDPILLDANGGQNFFQWFRVSAEEGAIETPRRWRACIRHAGVRRQTCGEWSDWDADPLAGVAPLAEGRRSRARVVASAPAGFLVALASPHELLVPASGKDPARAMPLPGEPTAIALAGNRAAVGTRAPGVVVVLGPGGARAEHRVPGGKVGGSEGSTSVASLALTEREVWVITGGTDGDPALRLLD